MSEAARFNIVFDGQVTENKSKAEVKTNLAQLFKCDLARIEPLFSGQPVVIKRDLDGLSADKYIQALYGAGAIGRTEQIIPATSTPQQAIPENNNKHAENSNSAISKAQAGVLQEAQQTTEQKTKTTQMVFCRGCGQQIHQSALACPHCGARQKFDSSSYASDEIPPGVKGWSWGAFLLNWIWAIGNSTWIGLLALIPYVGFVMAIILGVKGREWAWKNKHWESVEHFNRVQRTWSIWGLILVVGFFGIGMLAAITLPAYQDYISRAQMSEAVNLMNSAKVAVADYRATRGYCPSTNADAGLSNISNRYVESVNVASGCAIVATMKSTGVAHGIAGQTVTMTPALTPNGSIEWTCSSSAANKHLPGICRR